MAMQTEAVARQGADTSPSQTDRPPSVLRELDRDVGAFCAIFDAPEAPPTASASGSLAGRGFAVKEVLDQAGRNAGWGLDLLKDRVAETTAPVVSRILEAGAVCVGTTRSTALAITGDSGTRNPWDLTRTPGGSSAGSAAAVAIGAVDFAIGTQTVGSIVRPAAYCGVVGFKPTFGRVPTEGGMCLSAELDHVGFLAKDVATARDAYALFDPVPEAPADLGNLQLLFPDMGFDIAPEAGWPGIADGVRAAAGRLGWRAAASALPEGVAAKEEAILRMLLVTGIHANHGDWIRRNADKLPEELSVLEAEGARAGSDGLSEAIAARDRVRALMDAAVPDDAVLVIPSIIDVAPRIGEGTGRRDPQRLATLIGWPALSLPWGTAATSDGARLPLAVQLVARRGRDHLLLDVADRLEGLAPAPVRT
ncbi:Asp-tRNA(Asn)/Glu-tRNA(Gln) amidotransferase A subunit family amidase [Amorphus suaedae]